MKKDKKQSIREMGKGELLKRLEETSKQLLDMKMKFYTGGVKNVHTGKVLRHEIAFIKTTLTQRDTQVIKSEEGIKE